MPNTKEKNHREMTRAKEAIPVVPPPKNTPSPRKNDVPTAVLRLAKSLLHDQHKKSHRIQKNAYGRYTGQGAGRSRSCLDEAVRQDLLGSMPQWSFDHRRAVFVSVVPPTEQVLAVLLRRGVSRPSQVPLAALGRLAELVTAVRSLSDPSITLSVAGLTPDEAYVLRLHLPRGASLRAVADAV